MNNNIDPQELIQEAYERRRMIGAIALVVILLLGAIAWWLNRREHHSQDNLAQAEAIVFELTKGHKLFENPEGAKATQELIGKLQALAKDDSEVRARMNGILAEIDIIQGNVNRQAPLQAIKCLEKAPLPLFQQFSEVALLSQKGRPREALELADKLLKADGIADSQQLYAFTLLQKAALCKALNKTDEMKKALEELRIVIKKRPDLLTHLQEEGITLLDFLEKNRSSGI